jgi:hypothetical protein
VNIFSLRTATWPAATTGAVGKVTVIGPVTAKGMIFLP